MDFYFGKTSQKSQMQPVLFCGFSIKIVTCMSQDSISHLVVGQLHIGLGGVLNSPV